MKRIGLASIFSRLRERFLLEELQEAIPSLYEVIVPVVDVGELVREPDVYEVLWASVVSQFVDVVTVPVGERWTVSAFYLYRSSGDRTITEVQIKDRDGHWLAMDVFAAASFYVSGVLPHSIEMGPGWIMSVGHPAGGTTEGTWTCALLLKREKSY